MGFGELQQVSERIFDPEIAGPPRLVCQALREFHAAGFHVGGELRQVSREDVQRYRTVTRRGLEQMEVDAVSGDDRVIFHSQAHDETQFGSIPIQRGFELLDRQFGGNAE